MIFVFEDKEDDLLSILFRSAYTDCSFVYTNGNGNIANRVEYFEKYCKLILLKCVQDCVRHSKRDNNLYGFYYSIDCLCNKNESTC